MRNETVDMKNNAPFFLGLSLGYGVCFAIAFYKNFIGITYPFITAATLGACGLFLKKYGIPWKNPIGGTSAALCYWGSARS